MLEFKSGIHVGWGTSRNIVDHVTILRSILAISSLASMRIFDEIRKGGVKVSALMPLIVSRIRDKAKLVLIPPKIPSKLKGGVLGCDWITIKATKEFMEFVRKCLDTCDRDINIESGIISSNSERFIEISCCNNNILRLRIVRLPRYGFKTGGKVVKVAMTLDEELWEDAEVSWSETMREYRNRMDRVSGATDIFTVEGCRWYGPLWIAIECDDNVHEDFNEALKILSIIGLGGLRSRGWGKFEISDDNYKVIDEDIQMLKDLTVTPSRFPSYGLLLGSYLPSKDIIDPERSFANEFLIEGFSGPSYSEYRLPTILSAGEGSLILFIRSPKPKIIEIDYGSPFPKPLIVFNPVILW